MRVGRKRGAEMLIVIAIEVNKEVFVVLKVIQEITKNYKKIDDFKILFDPFVDNIF